MKKFRIFLVGVGIGMTFFGVLARAEIKTENVTYQQGDATLEGFLAYDDAKTGKRPGVLIVHEWMGLGDYVKGRAQQLAKMGYVAFAADIYGKGVRPRDAKEAGEFAGKYKNDRALLRARVQAALDVLQKDPHTNASKVAAIGYCFGGTTALELARSGAPLKGTIGFHCHLDTPNLADAKNIKGKILVLHGAADPYVPQEQIATFKKEMDDAKVDHQFIAYPEAVHSYTVPTAGNDPSKGAAYNEKADKASFKEMKKFLAKVLK